MSSIPISVGVYGGENQGSEVGLHICSGKNLFSNDPFNISFNGIKGGWFKSMQRSRVRIGRKFTILSRVKKGKKHDYPWPDDIDPNIKSGHLTYLSYFKPLQEKPKPVTLPFEKPLVDLEKKINEVRRMADETGLDFSTQISSLKSKYQQALKELYKHLTPIQRLSIARHPNRPTVLDHILNITEKWVELHGDRAGYDDPAIVTGIGSIDGKSYVFIGHQKGRNTKENIARNFAMPTPHGYRKALRMMKYADHHSLPIITFIDTPGAFADLKSEELGQGEAIAYNLRTMFGLKVPIVTVVTGEGGSGGALAIGCSNKLFMLENSAFYVASPEACAAILWKSSQAAPKAAEKLKITAEEHLKLKIADGIIPEPLGGAHSDPAWTSQQIRTAIIQAMEDLSKMDIDTLLRHRMLKFRSIGGIKEGVPADPKRKRNMKASEIDNSSNISGIETEIERLKKKILQAKEPLDDITNEEIEKLKKDVNREITNAFISMGLKDKLETLKLELSRASDSPRNLLPEPKLKQKMDQLMQEFDRKLSQPGVYVGLKNKLEKLNMINLLVEQRKKKERLKFEINQKVQAEMKEKMEALKNAQEKLAEGDRLDENLVNEMKKVKEELKEVLKLANLEIVGTGKRKMRTSLPDSEEEIVSKANEEVRREIERAVNVSGLRGKIEELKAEIVKGSSPDRVKKLEAEIKDGVASFMDSSALKQKFENIKAELLKAQTERAAGGSLGVDNGRG